MYGSYALAHIHFQNFPLGNNSGYREIEVEDFFRDA